MKRTKSLFFLVLVAMIFVTACSKQQPVGWTKWRGENRDGISKETVWDAAKLDSSNVRWTKNIGFGHSAITVLGDNCFVTGWIEKISGKDTLGEDVVRCLDIATGKELWAYSYPSADRSFPGPRSTPVIDEENLYTLSWEGKLFCLDINNGKEKWKVDLVADSLCIEDRWGICPSPVIVDNLILLNLNKSGIAIDKNSGKVVWNSERQNAHYSSVQFVTYNGQTAAVFMSDNKVYLVEPASGNVLLEYEKQKRKGMENDPMITASGDIFLSSELLKFDGSLLRSVWQCDSVSSSFRGGVLLGNYAYQFSDNKNKSPLLCVDVLTGKPQWVADLGTFGALIAVSDKLVILAGHGKVIIANASPEKFQIVKELQVLPAEDKEENWCWAIPTFCNGKLFVRNSHGDMACIDLSI